MAEWTKKVKYYVKVGDGYLAKIESDLPVLAESKSIAREFTELEVAEATVTKLQVAGFSKISIETDEEMVLDE